MPLQSNLVTFSLNLTLLVPGAGCIGPFSAVVVRKEYPARLASRSPNGRVPFLKIDLGRVLGFVAWMVWWFVFGSVEVLDVETEFTLGCFGLFSRPPLTRSSSSES